MLGAVLCILVKEPEFVVWGKDWASAAMKQTATLVQDSVQSLKQQSFYPRNVTSKPDSTTSSDTANWDDSTQSSSSSAQTDTSTAAKSTARTAQSVWDKKTATVYFDLPANISSQYRTAWQQAVNNWNSYKVFKLVVSNNKQNADIVLTVENQSNTSMAGVTETRTLFNNVNNEHFLIHAVSKLNIYYLDNYSLQRKINTAEHELGHALGLAHDTAEASVMQPQGSEYGIQKVDVQHLKELYP
ncbi:hypothetical protein FD46_GL001113 [Liquorilactobacillus oeni DSM 19972]|uniref:Peptidase M10 metallopeptidase domain-containing protein n=1 Tax=Liquorilactobacillus oeni DSM 19972 TaxID=1423777 RepID=A0A0R1MJ35_9LACO|nr:hypothetical protein FD46_GL001113 [Liquorilactobacillus oeni DSM 19972]